MFAHLRRMPLFVQVVAVFIALNVLWLGVRVAQGLTSGMRAPQSFSINGEFTLNERTDGPDSNCSGRGGYSDIAQGLPVTVRNESGTILGTSRLGPGTRSIGGFRCEFTFVVRGIPRSQFYSIEVGRRGELNYSHSEIVARNWRVTASLG